MKDNFVTIKTFTYPQEAAIIQGKLESEGIECFLKDELTAQVNPFYSNAIGGVKLQVKECDRARANEIVNEGLEKENVQNQKNIDVILDAEKSKIEIYCPSCGSSNEISKPFISKEGIAISILLLGFPFPFLKKTYHCFSCGIDFKRK